VVQFSKPLWGELEEIRKFLFKNMYRAEPVLIQREHAALVVSQLFECFMNAPQLLPYEWRGAVLTHTNDLPRARVIADYISGMTDRFAQQEFDRLLATR
jgi:dGTPase